MPNAVNTAPSTRMYKRCEPAVSMWNGQYGESDSRHGFHTQRGVQTQSASLRTTQPSEPVVELEPPVDDRA